jgi:hypothetical protein
MYISLWKLMMVVGTALLVVFVIPPNVSIVGALLFSWVFALPGIRHSLK